MEESLVKTEMMLISVRIETLILDGHPCLPLYRFCSLNYLNQRSLKLNCVLDEVSIASLSMWVSVTAPSGSH